MGPKVALNPNKWLEFKLQDRAKVSHNTHLFRILRNCLITGPIPDYIGELSDLKILQWVAKDGELDFPKFYEDNHTSKKTNDWIHLKCRELHQEMVNVQAAAIKSGTPLTQEEISRQVLGQKKRYLLGFGSGPQPSTIFATRAHDKDMEAMRAEVEALREERQKDHDELMKEREERERCYNELLKEREERIQLSNEMLKEREEGQKARDETNTKVEHLNNVVAKLSQLLGI
ncbi:unnamed protein product [Camellia sinensis]